MDGDDLAQVIQSCIRCGNNISKRSLNLLSSAIQRLSESSADQLISIIQHVLCDYDSPVVPTRILLSISNNLQNLENKYFQTIIHSTIKMTNSSQLSSIISPLRNSVFILPTASMPASKATHLASRIIDLMHNFVHQNDSFQIIATALSQFMKKWSHILSNKNELTASLFTLLSNASSLTYATLSLVCQSVVYLILAILGDAPLKEVLESLVKREPTVLDQCTSVSNINFMDFALQTLPQSAQFQLIATLIFSLPPEKLKEVANRFDLIKDCISNPPADEIGRTCYFTMLSAVLKATAKQMTPKALNIYCEALLAHPETQDNANRRAMKWCFNSLLQCTSHIQNSAQLNERLFQRILALSPKSLLRQDALPMIIPCVPFSNINIEFWNYLIGLFDTQFNLALKCISEIYKKFDVPMDYSVILFKKLDQMNSQTRTMCLNSLLKTDAHVMEQIKDHATKCPDLDENRRLVLLLTTASFEAKNTRKPVMAPSLLKSAIHSWDFEVRMSALHLLCGQLSYNNDHMLSIMYETIPRVFVYCDIKFAKQLERCLNTIIRNLNDKSNSFIDELMHEMIPLLRPHQSGVKKSYIINMIKTIWRHKPLYLLNNKLIKQLILGLFESSYVLRDQFFSLLLMIVRISQQETQQASQQENSSELLTNSKLMIKEILNDDNKFTHDIIFKYKDSPRFRESDGAARLIALIQIVQKSKPLDTVVNEMWIDYASSSAESSKNGTIPSHFPLSVILHILQSMTTTASQQDIQVKFLVEKLLPNLVQLIKDSLAFMGVETNIESVPIHAIRTDPPESQLHDSVNKSWIVVRQGLNIITVIINRHFDEVKKELVEQLGDALFNFLVESRHFSTVFYAHLTFQTLCTRCFMREDCSSFPKKWTEILLDVADSFSSADHKASGGFVQTATALIHSEPSHLFGSQRSIYHLLLQLCFTLLDKTGTNNQLRSALLLTEAIAKDSPTQGNLEPYAAQLLMSVFILTTVPMDYELKCCANHCLTALLLKYWDNKDQENASHASSNPVALPNLVSNRDFENASYGEFFQSANAAFDFFFEHLSVERSDATYVLLQVIQIMKPFPQENLFAKIAELRASPYSHVRRSAARSLLIVIPQENVEEFSQQCLSSLSDFITSNTIMTSNAVDGTLQQLQQICRHFQSAKELLRADVEKLCKFFIEKHEKDYMKIFTIVRLAKIFGCLELLKPLLLSLFKIRQQLIKMPLGKHIIRATFSVLSDEQKSEVLTSNDSAIIFNLIIFISNEYQNQPQNIPPKIQYDLIELYLRDSNQAICDFVTPLLYHPNDEQKQRFLNMLYKVNEDAKFASMLSLAPQFITDAKDVFNHLIQYSKFIDRSDSNVLGALSQVALQFREQLFSSFDPNSIAHWKVALRILSDDNPSVRLPCCRALSLHLDQNRMNGLYLCEYDLIEQIYTKMNEFPEVLRSILDEFKTFKEDEGETHFKKEPTPFLHPPSFHVQLIESILNGQSR